MLIVMRVDATQEDIDRVCRKIEELGFRPHAMPGANRTAIGITGNPGAIESGQFEDMSGIAEVIPVTQPYKLVSRELKPDNTEIRVGNVVIGGPEVVVMAGACGVESEEQTLRIAEQVRSAGAHVFRGGAFKPRTSPYSFQGLGLEGLKILREAGDRFKLLVISEVMEISQIELMLPYIDIFQQGARTMQNFNLLRELGQVPKPLLL